MPAFPPAAKPTFYFIGVTTHQSSIMRVFPRWAAHLGLGDVAIQGINFAPNSAPELYREAVAFIKRDPLSVGALITTHKLDLFAACHDLFDEVDPLAALLGEASCLSKRGGRLTGFAKDPITAGLTLDHMLPVRYFESTGAELFCMGAGGAAVAITWHVLQRRQGSDRPARIVVSERSPARLDHLRGFHTKIGADIPIEYVLAAGAADNDRALMSAPEGSLVINATGLGKDGPGSPLSDAAVFPNRATVWELNYRGELVFLEQAKAQRAARQLQVEDGWSYFIYGWTGAIAEVFGVDIATDGPGFEALSAIAAEAGR